MASQRFQNALNRVPQATPPIWFMRQAGRYHRHYQNLRSRHSFMELCKNPDLAASVALGPIEDFDFDVSIFFSDLLFPLEALGMGLKYTDHGPELGWILNEETIHDLKSPDQAAPKLLFQKEALQATRRILPPAKSLIGFVGSPWTLYAYAAQGKHQGSLIEAKRNLRLFDRFCEALVPCLIENIRMQFEGGAEIVMLFDTAAGELSPWIFEDLVVPQIKKLATSFPNRLGYYSKFTQPAFLHSPLFQSLPLAGIGVDHRWNLREVLQTSKAGFIQGGFDEALLFAEERNFKKLLVKYLEPLAKLTTAERAGWVCGLGHGVLPKTPEANVQLFVQTVREVFQ